MEVSIKGVRSSSLLVFFGVMLTAYNILSSFRDFYDSMHLIRREAERLLEAALKRFGELDINVSILHPSVNNRGDLEDFLHVPRFYGTPIYRTDRPYRDGFFYFLLIFCLFQLIVIGLLVYGAVVKTYF